MKYYLLCDQSVQWFTYLGVFHNDTMQCEYAIPVPPAIGGNFLNNIFDREPNFQYEQLQLPQHGSDIFVGWSLSKGDYERLNRIVELHKYHREYQELLK